MYEKQRSNCIYLNLNYFLFIFIGFGRLWFFKKKGNIVIKFIIPSTKDYGIIPLLKYSKYWTNMHWMLVLLFLPLWFPYKQFSSTTMCMTIVRVVKHHQTHRNAIEPAGIRHWRFNLWQWTQYTGEKKKMVHDAVRHTFHWWMKERRNEKKNRKGAYMRYHKQMHPKQIT